MTPRFEPSTLRSFARAVLDGLGAPTEAARRVAGSLVRADSRGYGTHGVGILPLYADMVEDRAIDPTAVPSVTRGEGATVRVDGKAGFGQLAAREATAEGVALAERRAVSVVGFHNASHIGLVGEFARRATEAGLVFAGFTNTAGGATNTAAFGGAARKLSTNPIAFGIPSFDALPFDIVADFATSQVSGSVIREHNRTGESLDEEWTTTENGEPVDDPGAFVQGSGALLPLGGRTTGHKGYALSVVAELLGGVIGGNPVVGEADPEWLANGGSFVFIDPTAFVPVSTIETRLEAVGTHLRSEDGVRLPGEGAHRRAQESRERGIAVPEHDLVPLAETAAAVGVTPPAPIRNALTDADLDGTSGDGDTRTW